MSRQQPTMDRGDWTSLLMLASIWGFGFVVFKAMGSVYTPVTFAFIRSSIGALYLACYLKWVAKKSFFAYRQYFPLLLIMSVFGNLLPFCISGFAVPKIGAGLASIINALNPIFTVIFVHIFFNHHRLSPVRLLGVMIGFFGITTMIGWDILIQQSISDWQFILFQLIYMLAGVSYASQAAFSRRKSLKPVPAVIIVMGQNFFSSILLLPMIFIFDDPLRYDFPPKLEIIAMAIIYNILSMGYAYVLYFELIKKRGAVNGSLVSMIMPPISIIYAALYFGETLKIQEAFGLLVLLWGLIMIDGRLLPLVYKKIKQNGMVLKFMHRRTKKSEFN